MNLDLKPNFQIDPNLFSSLANRYSGGLGAFQQQYDRSSERAKGVYEKQRWMQAIDDLMKNPNVPESAKQIAPMIALHPELAGQLMPEILKQQQPKQKPEFSAVSGMMSDQGEPLVIDKFTGEVKPAKGVHAKSTVSSMAGERHSQFGINDLPWNQSPTTSSGAGFGVKMAARMGKTLIARATSPQKLALASVDLARAVQRGAPMMDTIGQSSYAESLSTRIGKLTQTINSDPSSPDVPKLRKELFDTFDELDKAATPFVQNQLDTMNESGYKITPNVRSRAMGTNLPEIKFEEFPVNNLGKGKKDSGWGIQRVQ